MKTKSENLGRAQELFQRLEETVPDQKTAGTKLGVAQHETDLARSEQLRYGYVSDSCVTHTAYRARIDAVAQTALSDIRMMLEGSGSTAPLNGLVNAMTEKLTGRDLLDQVFRAAEDQVSTKKVAQTIAEKCDIPKADARELAEAFRMVGTRATEARTKLHERQVDEYTATVEVLGAYLLDSHGDWISKAIEEQDIPEQLVDALRYILEHNPPGKNTFLHDDKYRHPRDLNQVDHASDQADAILFGFQALVSALFEAKKEIESAKQ